MKKISEHLSAQFKKNISLASILSFFPGVASLNLISEHIKQERVILEKYLGKEEADKYFDEIKTEAYSQLQFTNSDYIFNKLYSKNKELQIKQILSK